MSQKVFRDPLYNYVGIDRKRDGWLIDLLNCPEVQRLRRIHQLGVSSLTYPGADHNRLAHSLGVLHLTLQALRHLKDIDSEDAQVNQAREPLLATALLHDVGHGPFSHLFEPCLGIKHEVWSKKIVLDEDSKVRKILSNVAKSLPNTVAELIDANNHDHPAWMKYLLSSQLDMDRLDYLRRDSLFTGAGYGHFDWHRLLTTFSFYEDENSGRDLVWSEKAKLAIEEYIFARFYMYQNVYLHKTTRGFEKMIEAMWRRARKLNDDGTNVSLVPKVRAFWKADDPSVAQYLAIEEFSVLQQIQNWTTHKDPSLSDLARRFLCRDRFAMIEPPYSDNRLASDNSKWEMALHQIVRKAGYKPATMYCLKDQVNAKYHRPYIPEKESDEQSVKNAIRIVIDGEPKPVEISLVLDRLKPLTQRLSDQVRYFIPKDVQEAAKKMRSTWSQEN